MLIKRHVLPVLLIFARLVFLKRTDESNSRVGESTRAPRYSRFFFPSAIPLGYSFEHASVVHCETHEKRQTNGSLRSSARYVNRILIAVTIPLVSNNGS